LAETKATKAIQKHSMNIDGTEKIIKSMRLIVRKSKIMINVYSSLDAFNYILYKYSQQQ
jgi:hypothetical protein